MDHGRRKGERRSPGCYPNEVADELSAFVSLTSLSSAGDVISAVQETESQRTPRVEPLANLCLTFEMSKIKI